MQGKLKRGVVSWVGTKGYDILYRKNTSTNPGLGPEDDYWERWRRKTLPNLHNLFEWFDGYAQYPLDNDEYAGTIPRPPEEVEEILWDNGLIRNPLAALKTDPMGNVETGSWMYREERNAVRQVDVMLFRIESENDIITDVYAHEEYSAGHPDSEIAVKHYEGVDYDPRAGVEWVRTNLPVEQREQPFD